MNSALLPALFFTTCAIALNPQTLHAQPNGIDQPCDFIVNQNGVKILRWHGKPTFTYFIQVSDPSNHLAKWNYTSIIESGNDEVISHDVTSIAEKGFFRLHYTDQAIPPGKTIDTADFDNDGLTNAQEVGVTLPLVATNPLNHDTDGDGLSDGFERTYGFDPNDAHPSDPNLGPAGDPDNDGLTTAQEQAFATNPNNPDTDGDGTNDRVEIERVTDPNNSADFPVQMIYMSRSALGGDRPSESLPVVRSSGHGVWRDLYNGEQDSDTYYSYNTGHSLTRMLDDLGSVVYPALPEKNTPPFLESEDLVATSRYFNQVIYGIYDPNYEHHEVELSQSAIWIEAPPSPIERKRKFLKVTQSSVRNEDPENIDLLTGEYIVEEKEERAEVVTITTAPNQRYSERYDLTFPADMAVQELGQSVQDIVTHLLPVEVKAHQDKNGPQGSVPKYNDSPSVGSATNLFSVWPNEEIILKVKIPPPFDQQGNLPANLIKLDVPGHTFAANILEASMKWGVNFFNAAVNTKEITITIGGTEFKVHVKVQGTGLLSEAEGAALVPHAAPVMLAHSFEATNYTNSTFPVSPKRDAIRHAYWCSLSVSTFPVTAGDVPLISTGHERDNRYNDKQQAFNSTMDLKNNAVGISVNRQVNGLPDKTAIKQALEQLYTAGEMYIWEVPPGAASASQGDSEGIVRKSDGTKIH